MDGVEEKPFDVARFGRVCTWDPRRMDGARGYRIQEFRAEDVFLDAEVELNPEGYRIIRYEDNTGCIGLVWTERRRLTTLSLKLNHTFHDKNVEVQGWVGESHWQGEWKPLKGVYNAADNRLQFDSDLDCEFMAKGVRKIRWVIPECPDTLTAVSLSAETRNSSRTDRIFLECCNSGFPNGTTVDAYNCEFSDGEIPSTSLDCSGKKSVEVELRWLDSSEWSAERAVLRISGISTPCAIAVDDIVENGCVWVPISGVSARTENGPDLQKYLQDIDGHQTIRQQVRTMPDQTFDQALKKTRNPIQDNGPTLLSLACDNHKFVAHQDGSVQFHLKEIDETFRLPSWMEVRIAGERLDRHRRGLTGEWLPAVLTQWESDGMLYSQHSFVVPVGDSHLGNVPVWVRDGSVLVTEFTITNNTAEKKKPQLHLMFLTDRENGKHSPVQVIDEYISVTGENGEYACVQAPDEFLSIKDEIRGEVELNGELESGQSVVLRSLISATGHSRTFADTSTEELYDRMASYWESVFAEAISIYVPDRLLTNVIKASQVHCLTAARSEENGQKIAAWIGAVAYGPLESEAHSIIWGMGLLGHEQFAKRSLEFFIKRYNKEGFLTTGYTIMGTGWHLWILGRIFHLFSDPQWMKTHADEVARVCDWVIRQQQKTKRLSDGKPKDTEYGLMPPGVMADWNVYAYYFYLNGYYHAGLQNAASALKEINHPETERISAAAQESRNNISRAFETMRKISPVVKLRDGRWVHPYPSQLHTPGRTADFFPGEDANRSWAYDVDLGAHHLVPQGVLASDSDSVQDMLDHMEDVQFLLEGWHDYPAEKNEQDWFNLGGFAKVQPYYGRYPEIYALQKDVKPFIRCYFNMLTSLLNTENLSLWEHFNNMAAWNKTHETGYFLEHTRLMLLNEYGNELWIAPLVTDRWFQDGMVIVVDNAPTRFGKTSYRIESHVRDGYLQAIIDTTAVNAEQVVLCLRHPESLPIRELLVNGHEHKNYDADQGTIRLIPAGEKLYIHASYNSGDTL